MARELHDHYFRQAKREGYRSRAAYKLIEIDDRRRVLHQGDAVLDCGAAPGSWMQVAAQRIGPRGVVVGIDLKPITPPLNQPNALALVGDLRETPAMDLLAAARQRRPDVQAFDVVLSDMAPSTTGDRVIDHHASMRLCHAVLDRCGEVLRPGGTFVMKALEGEAYPELLDRAGRLSERAKGFRPKASRGESTEMFLIGHGFTGAYVDAKDEAEADARRPSPPTRKPSKGWGG